MKLKQHFIIFFFIIITCPLNAQKMDIGIFQHLDIKKLFIEAPAGKYRIKVNGKTIYTLKGERSIILNYVNGYINISNEKKDYGLYKNIEIVAKKYKYDKIHDKQISKKNCELNIKLLSPKQDTRTYQGNLKIYHKKEQLETVNQIALPDYLAGVVEAESGPNELDEYYKNQAVICRTYALESLAKHKDEGFNLCDGVHCQAYKGKSTKNSLIPQAVKSTKDLVIVDENNKLISALFSANCGGQTNNSEDVWSSPLSYLKSRNDEYCTDQRQATWTKKISFNEWKDFLKNNSIVFSDTLAIDSFAFEQAQRKIYYTINNQNIKLTTIRHGLKLRSTFFSIQPDGDQLILSGKGYGHGVGMCQEGAMNMARKGYKFEDIIKYYYRDVKIVPFSNLKYKMAGNEK